MGELCAVGRGGGGEFAEYRRWVWMWTCTSCMVRGGAESRRAFGVLVPYPRARRLRRGWSWTRWRTWQECVLVLNEGKGE